MFNTIQHSRKITGPCTCAPCSSHDERRSSMHLNPPPPRTKWTSRVPHPVLIGHVEVLDALEKETSAAQPRSARGWACARTRAAPVKRRFGQRSGQGEAPSDRWTERARSLSLLGNAWTRSLTRLWGPLACPHPRRRAGRRSRPARPPGQRRSLRRAGLTWAARAVGTRARPPRARCQLSA